MNITESEEDVDCNFSDAVEGDPMCVKQIRKLPNGKRIELIFKDFHTFSLCIYNI